MQGTAVEIAALLADLVRVPSVNPRGRPEPAETPLAAFIADWCAAASVPARLTDVADGRCNVIAEVPGQRDEWVLLETHLDTVAAEGMTIAPFDPVVANGRLYGRGACDAKASLAVFLAVLATLAADPVPPPRGVRLVGAIDEEQHYLGVTHLLDSGAAAAGTTVGAVVGEPTALRLVIAHGGCMRCQIMTTGPGGHSSAPAGRANAIEIAADVVAYLRDEVAPSLAGQSQPLVGAPTLAVTMITGGSGPNVLPARCAITVDRRLVPGEEAEAVWAGLKSGLETRWPGSVRVLPPFITDPPLLTRAGDPFVRQLQHHLAAARLDPAVMGAGYGTDASKLAAAGIPAVVFGPGSIEDAHSAAESVELAQLPVAARVLTGLLRSPGELLAGS